MKLEKARRVRRAEVGAAKVEKIHFESTGI